MAEMALAEPQQRGVVRTGDGQPAAARLLSTEVLIGATAYHDIAVEWQRLADLQKSPVVFQDPSLLAVWAKHFADGGKPVTVVVRDKGEPVLIWPLFAKRHALVKIATGAGAPLGQYDELLLHPAADPGATIKAAFDALSETVRPDLIFLERVREDSALRACLAGETPSAADEAAPYTDLSEGLSAILASRKTRFARHQRKRMRDAEERGATFEVADDPATAVKWLAEAMALKREWLRSSGRISRAFASSELENCITDIARALATPGSLPRIVMSRLTLDGKTASIDLGLLARGTYHLYLGAYAPEFAKRSPGNVLRQYMLEWCIANGVTRYDVLAPRTRNKHDWQSGEVAVLNFTLPLTARGRMYEASVLNGLLPLMRRAFYALPAPLRSGLVALALNRGGGDASDSSETPSEEA